jgi:hypothetical protein
VTEPGWIEVSREREMALTQESAHTALAVRGIRIDDLSPKVLRLDVGLDENRETYYRVRVHESVVGAR